MQQIPDAREFGIEMSLHGLSSGELCAIITALIVMQQPRPNKIKHVKLIKGLTGSGLKESKDFVEAVWEYNQVILHRRRFDNE